MTKLLKILKALFLSIFAAYLLLALGIFAYHYADRRNNPVKWAALDAAAKVEADAAAKAKKIADAKTALAEAEAAKAEAEAERIAAENAPCGDESMAMIMSRHFVERELKAPATAVFASYGSPGVQVLRTGKCTFEVIAYVDAQNGFGALIRSQYVATMEYLPASAKWSGSKVQVF